MAMNLGIEMFADFDQYAFPTAYVALATMALGIESSGGGVFVANPSGRVDQADQAVAQAAALHTAGIRHAGALHPNFIQPLVSGLSPTADEIAWASKVVEEYDKLGLKPSFDALMLKGQAMGGTGRWQEAVDAYNAAVKAKSGDKDAKKALDEAKKQLKAAGGPEKQ